MRNEVFKPIEGESSKDLGEKFENKPGDGSKDIVIQVNGFTFVFQCKAYFKSSIDRISVTEVESTVRVGNSDVKDIRRGEFDARFLVVLKYNAESKILWWIFGKEESLLLKIPIVYGTFEANQSGIWYILKEIKQTITGFFTEIIVGCRGFGHPDYDGFNYADEIMGGSRGFRHPDYDG
ncbi:1670_t:CDS:2, partial [Dentiscutata heterogama]